MGSRPAAASPRFCHDTPTAQLPGRILCQSKARVKERAVLRSLPALPHELGTGALRLTADLGGTTILRNVPMGAVGEGGDVGYAIRERRFP
jgi:hypothetical protein